MKKGGFNIFSVLWSLLLHMVVIALLLLLHLNKPVVQAESGVPVMLGDMGNLDTDYDFTEVNSTPAPAVASVPVPDVPQAEPVITQDMEQTVAIDDGEVEKPEKPVETVRQPTPEEIRAEQERQAAQEAQNLMANAFGRSNTIQASAPVENNSQEQGTPGSVQGNSDAGKPTGVGNYGTWDLNGRSMRGELPRPDYAGIQEEGRVVVTITVDPDGNVIKTQINNRTNTTNLQLRQVAEEAAAKTKFNKVDGLNNVTGTITYYFKLK